MMKQEEEMKMTDWQNLTKKERRQLKKEHERQEREMRLRRSRLIKWGSALGIIVLVVGGIFLANYLKSQRFANAPRLEVNPTAIDMGKISLKEKKQTSFTIKNSGVSPLTLLGAKTSCDCTTAQFKIGENQSPVFGMHDPPTWSATLEVGEEEELVVFYEPKIHPVLGPVTRVVAIFSNDPASPEKRVTISANVEK